MGLDTDVWRAAVQRAMARPVSDWAWERAIAWGWASEAADRFETGDDPRHVAVAWLANRLRELEGHQRGAESVQRGGRSRRDHRATALAALHARRAEDLPEVQAFRREVLRGRLVRRDRLQAWMDREERGQGHGTRYVRVPLRDDGLPDLTAHGADLLPEHLETSRGRRKLAPLERFRQQTEWLWYQPDPVAAKLRECRVRASATTGRLKHVVDLVNARLGILDYEATALILCGSPPRAAMQFSVRHPMRARGVAPTALRMEIEAVPWLTPQKLAAIFARERRTYGSPRALSEKQATLADFADRMNDGRTWASALEEWNAQMRTSWRYEGDNAEKRFAAHAGDAFHRLTGERLKWRRRQGERAGRARATIGRPGVARSR